MENFIEPEEEDREEDFTPGCCFPHVVNMIPPGEVNPCLIYGCRDFEIRCTRCGRLVSTAVLTEKKETK